MEIFNTLIPMVIWSVILWYVLVGKKRIKTYLQEHKEKNQQKEEDRIKQLIEPMVEQYTAKFITKLMKNENND